MYRRRRRSNGSQSRFERVMQKCVMARGAPCTRFLGRGRAHLVSTHAIGAQAISRCQLQMLFCRLPRELLTVQDKVVLLADNTAALRAHTRLTGVMSKFFRGRLRLDRLQRLVRRKLFLEEVLELIKQRRVGFLCNGIFPLASCTCIEQLHHEVHEQVSGTGNGLADTFQSLCGRHHAVVDPTQVGHAVRFHF